MTIKSGVLILILLLTGSTVFAYQDSREMQLSARDIESFSINCGAGFLKVIGEKNRHTIQVTADIRSRRLTPARAKQVINRSLELKLRQQGNRAVLVSRISSHPGNDLMVDLTVYVPERFHLDINDGSGEMIVRDIAGIVTIDDGSGGMDLLNLGSAVHIDDGSGAITLKNAGGDVDIEDGSGVILVSRVNGNLTVDDSSGEIRIAGVGGNVRIRDGSGSINIREVGQDVHIIEAGSGGLHISQVKGNIFTGHNQSRHDRTTGNQYVF